MHGHTGEGLFPQQTNHSTPGCRLQAAPVPVKPKRKLMGASWPSI
jgi:hypothetical protein